TTSRAVARGSHHRCPLVSRCEDRGAMRMHVVERCAWAVAVAALLAAAHSWYVISRPAEAPAPAIWPVSQPTHPIAADSLAVLTSRIVGSDPFRLDRKPADVAYGATPDSLAGRASTTPTAPRP